MEVLYTGEKGFKVPPEAVHEAGNPRIRVLVIKHSGSVWKEKRSDGGTRNGTECAWMGKDNKVMEMVPVIVHM